MSTNEPRKMLSTPRSILVETAIGVVSMDIDAKYVRLASRRRSDGQLSYQGKTYTVRMTLQQLDGAWVAARTEAGNESDASLDVFEDRRELNPLRLGNTATRRAIRDVLLAAVNAHLSAQPELHAQAVRAAASNEILSTEELLAKARATVAQLEAKLAQLVAAEVA